jgi:cell division protein FtsL
MNDAHLTTESGQQEQPSEATKTKVSVSRPSLSDSIKRYSELILTIIPAIVGLIVAVYAFISAESGTNNRKESLQLDEQFNDLRLAVTQQMTNQDELSRKIQKIENTISSLSSIPKEDVLYLQIQQLTNGVTELKSREDKIEAVILNNPSKALEMPLIERDVENIKTAEQTNFASMKDSVDRIYDLNKWLLGAMAVGILTLAISNFLKSTDK